MATSRIDQIERQIEALTDAEFAELRRWIADKDWEAWDRQFEADVAAGKLDALGEQALREHAAGLTTPL